MEIQKQQQPIFDPTADEQYAAAANSFNNDNNNPIAPIPEEMNPADADVDTFDQQSQLPPREYYKQMVEHLHISGQLEHQPLVSQVTDDFIKATKKDPISLLHIYHTISGEPQFQFHDYELARRPDKNKFIVVSEIDGRPIFGTLEPSKKEAKRSCVIRIIDKLVNDQRFNCVNEEGRKIKHPQRHPRPLPFTSPMKIMNTEQQELACLGVEYYRQQAPPPDPQMATFAEDIDLDDIPQQPIMPQQLEFGKDFERVNQVPPNCKDPAQFVRIRAHAFRLFCENAFWREVQIEQAIIDKLNQCGLWSDKWNVVAFVEKCIKRAISWKDAATQQPNATGQQGEEGQHEQLSESGPKKAVVDQQMAVDERKEQMQGVPTISLDYFIFTLPYIPPRYASLALFNDQIYYGQLSHSKSQAKVSCANVMAAKMVEMGWADLEKKPKAAKKRPTAKGKKRKVVATSSVEDISGADTSTPILQEHQYLLTLHPNEQLDPRTHFLLASNPAKNPVQLLNEIASKQRMEVNFEEESTGEHADSGTFTTIVHLQPPGIPGLPRDITGQPFNIRGNPERNKKAAKMAAARATLDHLVRTAVIRIEKQSLANFKSAIKRARLCECCKDAENVEKGDQDGQKQHENVEAAIGTLGLGQ